MYVEFRDFLTRRMGLEISAASSSSRVLFKMENISSYFYGTGCRIYKKSMKKAFTFSVIVNKEMFVRTHNCCDLRQSSFCFFICRIEKKPLSVRYRSDSSLSFTDP